MTVEVMSQRPRWQRPLIVVGICLALLVPTTSWLLPRLATPPAPTAVEKPRVTMMTALPIGLAGSVSLAATLDPATPADPLIARLEEHITLRPVDALDAATLAQTDMLLLAHPGALPPETLVLIDQWLRSGGRAVVLADGLSSWPTIHPLGDPRNPPVTSLLTPLLTRWGLTLDAPAGMVSELVSIEIGGHSVRFLSPGRLTAQKPVCTVDETGMIGDCRLGRGRAIVIADADFLHADQWAGRGNASTSPGNIAWMLDNLAPSPAGVTANRVGEPTR